MRAKGILPSRVLEKSLLHQQSPYFLLGEQPILLKVPHPSRLPASVFQGSDYLSPQHTLAQLLTVIRINLKTLWLTHYSSPLPPFLVAPTIFIKWMSGQYGPLLKTLDDIPLHQDKF